MSTPGTLDEKKRRIMDALRTRPGEWFKRSDLAAAMGVKVLNQGDRVLLELMIESGAVEGREVDTYAPSGKRFEYRVKS